MGEDELHILRGLITGLVESERNHGVPIESIAAIFGEHVAPEDMLTDDSVLAVVDAILADAPSRARVILSRDKVAEAFSMTAQSVSWHVKQGNLQAVNIRVDGRLRVGITLSSACEYFGVSPHTRDQMTARLPRDEEGNIKPVFWGAPDDPTTVHDKWDFSEEEMWKFSHYRGAPAQEKESSSEEETSK